MVRLHHLESHVEILRGGPQHRLDVGQRGLAVEDGSRDPRRFRLGPFTTRIRITFPVP